ncbi:MAG: transporter [Glaciihabitans sp.]|nr:transporter [Glaciihabitans sp.]
MTATTTAASAARRSPFAEPTRRVHAGWITLFATAWFGIWMAQLTPIQLLLPQQIEGIYNVANLPVAQSVLTFGVISGIAGAFALVAYPVTGFLSDRTTSRFGRRRPWILGGTLVFAIGLYVLGAQTSILGVGIFWVVSLTGFCIVSAAITATISDQVPVGQRGIVSGWVSAPQAIGTLAGLLLVLILGLSTFLGYALVAVLLVVLVIPFVLTMPDVPLRKQQRPRLSVGAVLSGFWINPLRFPDFGWTLTSRVLVNIGNALGTAMLFYFLEFGLGQEQAVAQDNLLILTSIYLLFFVVAALVFGRVSDRIGRRKFFVYVSAYLQGFAALLLAIVPDLSIAFAAAGLLGLGYGCFMAVDQALATQVLPDAHTRGKDLGIMNIATAVPQAVGPLLGGIVVATFPQFGGGFSALFIASALLAAIGGFAIMPVKSVR